MQFISSIAAFFAVTLSVLAWTISIWPRVRAVVAPRDRPVILSCNSYNGAVVANTGDRELFLSHILMQMTGREYWTTEKFTFKATLAPGGTLQSSIPFERARISAPDDRYVWVRGVSAPEWSLLLERAVSDRACFRLAFFAREDPLWTETQTDAGPSLNIVPAMGYLEYRALDGKYTRVDLASVAALQVKGTAECIGQVPALAKVVKQATAP